MVKNNFARKIGGGFLLMYKSKVILSGTLINNYALVGGSAAHNSDVILREAIFKNNSIALTIYSSNVTFSNTKFINNSGGAINSTLNFIDYNLFSGNTGSVGGAIFIQKGIPFSLKVTQSL